MVTGGTRRTRGLLDVSWGRDGRGGSGVCIHLSGIVEQRVELAHALNDVADRRQQLLHLWVDGGGEALALGIEAVPLNAVAEDLPDLGVRTRGRRRGVELAEDRIGADRALDGGGER